MAEYLTNDTDLKKVADAIRTKGKTSAALSYPDEYVTAIEAITTGVELSIVASVTTGATVIATKDELTVSGVSVNGSCTLIVPEAGTWNVKATLNGETSGVKSISITDSYHLSLYFIDPELDKNSWAKIREISDKGQGANYWSVGDCKAVTLNGTVGNLAFDSYVTYAFIIGFDHNASVEGVNRIHFQLAKTAASDGTDISFCDSKYSVFNSWVKPGAGYFVMNTADTTAGGWASTYMRTSICGTSLSNYSGTFIAVIPEELRSVLKSVTKYTDNTGNTGNKSTAESAVTATTDYFFMLSEYEIFGSLTYANTYEANKQAQYAYYSAGNSKIKYGHNNLTSGSIYWLRSQSRAFPGSFTWVDSQGKVGSNSAGYSLGTAPGFCV